VLCTVRCSARSWSSAAAHATHLRLCGLRSEKDLVLQQRRRAALNERREEFFGRAELATECSSKGRVGIRGVGGKVEYVYQTSLNDGEDHIDE
jgi:hypothetical protein